MHELLPTPTDDQRFFRMKAKGMGFKPCYWNGFVLAEDAEEAKEIVRDGYPGIGLGIQGIKYVKATGSVSEENIELRVMGATYPNAVVFRDGDEVKRVHRGMLKEV